MNVRKYLENKVVSILRTIILGQKKKGMLRSHSGGGLGAQEEGATTKRPLEGRGESMLNLGGESQLDKVPIG